MEKRRLSDLHIGDMVMLCTSDTRYEDEKKFIKSIGPKWITLENDYRKVKYSVEDGMANNERPGYYIKIPKTDYEKEWDQTFNYLVEQVAPRYLEILDLDKLKHIQRRWTKKILENDGKNNSAV